MVNSKEVEIGKYVWGDVESEKRLEASGEEVTRKQEFVLPTRDKYTGEWNAASERHGRGT